MAIQPQMSPEAPSFGNETFNHGVRLGISWHLTGDEEYRNPTAQHIVDFIRDNFLEPHQEGYLDDERLTDNAGFLVGWLVGKYVCSRQ